MKTSLLPAMASRWLARARKKSTRLALSLFLCASACVAAFALTGATGRSTASLDVGITELQPSVFRWEVQRSGIIEPYASSAVHSACHWSTRILSIVPEGTWVQAGDVVCQMDSSEIEEFARSREVMLIRFRARLDSALHDEELLSTSNERALAAAEYRFQTAEQELHEYQDGTLPQQIEEMERNLKMLSRQTQTAADNVSRSEQLWSMGLLDTQEMARGSLDLLKAQQKQDQLEGKLNLLTSFTQPRNNLRLEYGRNNALRNVARTKISNSLAATRARLSSLALERTVRIYERYYSRAIDSIQACTLRAPCDGQVIHGNSWHLRSRGITQIEEGAKVRQLQKVFEIPDTRRLKVSVPIDEALIYRVHEGMNVTVLPKGYEGMEVAGRIVHVAKYPRERSRYTPSVKDYWLDVELLPMADQLAKLSLKADVEVRMTLAEQPDALQIPREAITGVAGHNFVFVMEGGELVSRQIQLGEANGESVCVTSGLQAGDRLVTEMTAQHRQKLQDTLAAELQLSVAAR